MSEEDPRAVVAAGLSYRYPAARGRAERPALDGVDLEVSRGELFGLLGPNGGGKTTLSRILATSLVPTSGAAMVLGLDAAAEPEAVRRRIGIVFQSQSLDRKLTARENLRCQGRLYGLRGAALEERVAALLGRMGLAERSDERVETLSGGLRRRAELAKSLLHAPEALILDEPTSGVDPGARRDFWSLVDSLRAETAMTVLVATHLMEEADRCDRIAVLDQGRVVALGHPAALKSEIGGDVISVRARDPGPLAAEMAARLGVRAELVEGTIRVERPDGHAFIPALVEAFPGRIESVTLSKPTLEDVFIHRTRRRFWQEAAP